MLEGLFLYEQVSRFKLFYSSRDSSFKFKAVNTKNLNKRLTFS